LITFLAATALLAHQPDPFQSGGVRDSYIRSMVETKQSDRSAVQNKAFIPSISIRKMQKNLHDAWSIDIISLLFSESNCLGIAKCF